jgi:hypothetical protein
MGELMEGAMQQAAQPLRQAGAEVDMGRLDHAPRCPHATPHQACA